MKPSPLLVRVGLAVLSAGLVGACYKPPSPPTPARQCRGDSVPSSPEQLTACLEGFTFDSSYDASDEQPLTFITTGTGQPCPDDPKGRTCRYGPIAKIEPVVGAQKYKEDQLRHGRFIARIIVDSTQKESYKKYNLEPGDTTYWWVKTDESGSGGMSYFIRKTTDGRIIVPPEPRTLHRDRYSSFKDAAKEAGYDGKAREYRATMRWIWDLEDETAKGQCGSATCK